MTTNDAKRNRRGVIAVLFGLELGIFVGGIGAIYWAYSPANTDEIRAIVIAVWIVVQVLPLLLCVVAEIAKGENTDE